MVVKRGGGPIRKFSPLTMKHLVNYVYLYVDPRNSEIFYIGKGYQNRAFSHLEVGPKYADDEAEAEKAARIREIREEGLEPEVEILTHGFDNPEDAHRVEAAAIDLVGIQHLTNIVRGRRARIFGRMTAREVEALYSAEEAEIKEPTLLIRINQLFHYNMTTAELYDATRAQWVVGERREKVELAMAVFEGVIQEVYRVEEWFAAGSTFTTRDFTPDPKRWEFVGRLADESIRKRYHYKSVSHLWDHGAQNPIFYVNID